MTEPNQTSTTPTGVDLKAAGVDGWFFVLQQAEEQKALNEETIKNAREKIEAALGDSVDGTIDGRPVVRWHHTAAPRRFNKKALGKDHPDLIEKYTTVGQPGRRFELVKPKTDS